MITAISGWRWWVGFPRLSSHSTRPSLVARRKFRYFYMFQTNMHVCQIVQVCRFEWAISMRCSVWNLLRFHFVKIWPKKTHQQHSLRVHLLKFDRFVVVAVAVDFVLFVLWLHTFVVHVEICVTCVSLLCINWLEHCSLVLSIPFTYVYLPKKLQIISCVCVFFVIRVLILLETGFVFGNSWKLEKLTRQNAKNQQQQRKKQHKTSNSEHFRLNNPHARHSNSKQC